MELNFRVQVFKRAYEIMKATGKQFAVCLSKAWAIYRFAKKLKNNEKVSFSYENKDGSLRRAYGTLKNLKQTSNSTNKNNYKVFTYWDLEASAFRCFKIENLITTL